MSTKNKQILSIDDFVWHIGWGNYLMRKREFQWIFTVSSLCVCFPFESWMIFIYFNLTIMCSQKKNLAYLFSHTQMNKEEKEEDRWNTFTSCSHFWVVFFSFLFSSYWWFSVKFAAWKPKLMMTMMIKWKASDKNKHCSVSGQKTKAAEWKLACVKIRCYEHTPCVRVNVFFNSVK